MPSILTIFCGYTQHEVKVLFLIFFAFQWVKSKKSKTKIGKCGKKTTTSAIIINGNNRQIDKLYVFIMYECDMLFRIIYWLKIGERRVIVLCRVCIVRCACASAKRKHSMWLPTNYSQWIISTNCRCIDICSYIIWPRITIKLTKKRNSNNNTKKTHTN